MRLFLKKGSISDQCYIDLKLTPLGGFHKKNVILFNVVQVIASAVAWGVLAPLLDILIYAEPANKVFVQGVFAGIGDIIVVGILGSLLAYGYSKTVGKSSSLEREDD